MAELCLVGYSYRGYEMAYALDRAVEFGYSGVELRDWTDIDLATPEGVEASLSRAVEQASSRGLTVHSVFYSPLPVSRVGERADEEQAFGRVIDILAAYGVPILHTRLSLLREDGRGEVVAAGACEADYAAAHQALLHIAPWAEAAGVCIALETHMGTIHDTAAAQLRLVSAVESPAISASLDFANMLITYRDESLLPTIRAFGPNIGYVHIKNVRLLPQGYDWNVPLRWGDINYRPVLRALKDAGYRGPLAVEYCGTGDPDVFVEDDARYLNRLAHALEL